MKRLILLLPAVMLFGAGCVLFRSTPPARPIPAPAPLAVPSASEPTSDAVSVTSSEPVVLTYVDGKVVITDALMAQFAKEHEAQTEHRKASSLTPGHYLFSRVGSALMLVRRGAVNSYEIISHNLASSTFGEAVESSLWGGETNSIVLLLEPKSRQELYFVTAYGKGESRVFLFDLMKKTTKEVGTAGLTVDYTVAPTEDRLATVGVGKLKACTTTSPVDQACDDFGRFVDIHDLRTNAHTAIATLPVGNSYAREVYPPNMMAEGLRPLGSLAWKEAGMITAEIYSDGVKMEYPGTDRASLGTITFKPDQARVSF